jgi:hypothetical protein
MTARLAVLVKHVSELRAAGLKACHFIKEFHHRRIHPLGGWKRHAYECPWMVDPTREPIDCKLPICALEYCDYSDLTSSILCNFVSRRNRWVRSPIVQ